MSVIYEVNLAIAPDASEAFAQWLKPHMDQMLTFDGFQRADWFTRRAEDEEQAEPGTVLWTIHYSVRDRASLEAYFGGPAKAMRDDGLRRFGGQFKATRRILSRYEQEGALP